jgi:predicted nucleotidyltransferase
MLSTASTRDEIAGAVRAALTRGRQPAPDSLSVLPAAFPDITAVYLFGSAARGTAKSGSDIDLGLLYSAPPASTLLGQPFLVEAELSEQLGRQVQCVVMNTAPADLVHRILKDGALLLDSDKSHRIRFEVDARNRYFDLKPTLERYRQARNVG